MATLWRNCSVLACVGHPTKMTAHGYAKSSARGRSEPPTFSPEPNFFWNTSFWLFYIFLYKLKLHKNKCIETYLRLLTSFKNTYIFYVGWHVTVLLLISFLELFIWWIHGEFSLSMFTDKPHAVWWHDNQTQRSRMAYRPPLIHHPPSVNPLGRTI